MTQERLYCDPDLASFYDLENGWAADFDLVTQLARNADSVLDLGCGTGELAAFLAKTHIVCGVDPARAMLDVAARRPGGGDVTWVEGDARALDLSRSFDLIVLTGHAFQVFLTDADALAVLNTIARHLSAQGRFIFDTRNPAIRDWERWTPENTRRSLTHPRYGPVTAWTATDFDQSSQVLTYTTHYLGEAMQIPLTAASQIRFIDKTHLASLLDKSGLQAKHWYGDWSGNGFSSSTRDIIPLGGLA